MTGTVAGWVVVTKEEEQGGIVGRERVRGWVVGVGMRRMFTTKLMWSEWAEMEVRGVADICTYTYTSHHDAI